MALRNKSNDELLNLYDNELVLRLHNPKNLRDTRIILSHFFKFIGNNLPSTDAAKAFLAPYSKRKARTRYRYAQMLKAFMKWYGEPLDDVNVKVPRTLPSYTKDADIEKLLQAMKNKRSHKGCIERDLLLVELAWRTGMRRAEIAA